MLLVFQTMIQVEMMICRCYISSVKIYDPQFFAPSVYYLHICLYLEFVLLSTFKYILLASMFISFSIMHEN